MPSSRDSYSIERRAENERLPSLDGFRAVSILLIICSHVSLQNTPREESNNLWGFEHLGGLGVRFFFIISGFLITYLLLRENFRNRRIDKKSFYLRRALRIFPVFYTYLLVLAITSTLLSLEIPLPIFFSAGFFIQNFAPWGTTWLVAHTWSLAVEEQFYLLWPFFFSFFNKSKKIWVVIGMLLLGSLMRSFSYKYPELSGYFLAPFFMYADFLFSGCFLAYMFFSHKEKVVSFISKFNAVFVYLIPPALWFFSAFEFHPVYDKIFIPLSGTIIISGISFLMIYFMIKEKSLGYLVLNWPFVKLIGTLSYSIYLWQQLFFSPIDLWIFTFPQNILFTFVVAWISYTLIEKPFLKLKERYRIL